MTDLLVFGLAYNNQNKLDVPTYLKEKLPEKLRKHDIAGDLQDLTIEMGKKRTVVTLTVTGSNKDDETTIRGIACDLLRDRALKATTWLVIEE